MKKYFFFFLFSTLLSSATEATFYILAKSGLNLRSEASTTAKVLSTVTYGEEVTVLNDYQGDISIDGMNSRWCKVRYKNMVGFLVELYLAPHKAPTGDVESLDVYFGQVSTIAFKTEKFTKIVAQEGEGTSIQKILYKNGMEAHYVYYYEAGGSIYFLPHWDVQKLFLLLKQIKEFNFLNEYKIAYPTSSKIYKKGEDTVEIKVSDSQISIIHKGTNRYDITIYHRDNQAIVEYYSPG